MQQPLAHCPLTLPANTQFPRADVRALSSWLCALFGLTVCTAFSFSGDNSSPAGFTAYTYRERDYCETSGSEQQLTGTF